MDLVTQGLLGGVLTQSTAPREESRRASAVGFVAGMLADADTLIRSSADPLLTLEYHRHFTHALVFVPVGALVAALLFFPFLRARTNFKKLYLYGFLGYLPAGLLDACTSYGTHLFWPFSPTPVALNLIAIIDPLFSGILMFSFIYGLVSRSTGPARLALGLCLAYLGLGAMQWNRVATKARGLAHSRGHKIERMVVKPTMGNIILWRSVYMAGNRIYVDAIRAGVGVIKIYPGSSLAVYKDRPERTHPTATDDIRRFRKFSRGYIAVHPAQPKILGDIRYSMLPTSTRPLWGITLDAPKPGEHARYKTFRQQSPADRRLFLNMLLGR